MNSLQIINRTLLFLIILLSLPLKAFAGPQYLDKTGYAISGYDVVAYRTLESNPVGEQQTKAVPGNADITAEWNGAKWAFSTEENRDKFLENPEYYVPQYDGHCAYGVALNGKVPANPHLWRIIDDKLYLNVTNTIVGLWEKDIGGFITTADGNWGSIEKEPASKKKVPKFKTKHAPTKS